jgi:hypothetical protein
VIRIAVVHGCTTAFWWGAGSLTAGAIISAALFRDGVLAGQGEPRQQEAHPASQPAPETAVRA